MIGKRIRAEAKDGLTLCDCDWQSRSVLECVWQAKRDTALASCGRGILDLSIGLSGRLPLHGKGPAASLAPAKAVSPKPSGLGLLCHRSLQDASRGSWTQCCRSGREGLPALIKLRPGRPHSQYHQWPPLSNAKPTMIRIGSNTGMEYCQM